MEITYSWSGNRTSKHFPVAEFEVCHSTGSGFATFFSPLFLMSSLAPLKLAIDKTNYPGGKDVTVTTFGGVFVYLYYRPLLDRVGHS